MTAGAVIALVAADGADEWLAAASAHVLAQAPWVRVEVIPADFAGHDLLADLCLGAPGPALRGFAALDLDPPWVCLFPPFLPGPGLLPLLDRLGAATESTVVVEGEVAMLAGGGPRLTSVRLATAVRERLVAFLTSDGRERGFAGVLRAALDGLAVRPVSPEELGCPVELTRFAVDAPAWREVAIVAARDAGGAVVALDNGGRYTRPAATVMGAPKYLVDSRRREVERAFVEPPPALVVTLRDATVAGSGVVVTSSGAVVRESLINTEGLAAFSPFRRVGGALQMAATGPPVRETGRAVLLRQMWDGNYGHWLIEALPRIGMVAECVDLATCRFLISGEGGAIGRVYRDTLALMGVRAEQVVPISEAPVVYDELIFPAPLTEQPYVKAPRAIRFLEALGQRVPGPPGPPRIFVTRGNNPRRVLRNEAAVVARLARLGFVVVDPGEMSFAEQVAAFSGATHVIGNLGAALSNIVFAPRGVRLFALTTEFMQDDFFWDLVGHKDGSYLSLQGKAVDPAADMQSDFTIDMAAFEACLAQFLPDESPAVPAQPRSAEAIGIFCKSFRDDFARLRRMLDSMARCNVERIPFALSLPEQDIGLFRERFPDADFPVVADHELTGFRQDGIGGWQYQQMVKLCCDRSGVAENLFVVDSDFYFIRPFRRAEFVGPDGVAFTRLSPHGHTASAQDLPHVLRLLDNGPAPMSPEALQTLRSGQIPDLTGDREALRRQCKGTDFSAVFGHKYVLYHCMSGPVLHAAALRLLREQPANVGGDGSVGAAPRLLVGLSSWEYNWHAEYLFASTLEMRVAPLLVFHVASAEQLDLARQNRITDERLSHHYLAVAMAARHFDELSL